MSGVPSVAREVAAWLRVLAGGGKVRKPPTRDELRAAALYLEQLADEWTTSADPSGAHTLAYLAARGAPIIAADELNRTDDDGLLGYGPPDR